MYYHFLSKLFFKIQVGVFSSTSTFLFLNYKTHEEEHWKRLCNKKNILISTMIFYLSFIFADKFEPNETKCLFPPLNPPLTKN